MSDPSFNDTVNSVKTTVYNSTSHERDWWNGAQIKARESIVGSFTDIVSQLGIASENAYQQDYTAKLNQLVHTKYDSLPETVKISITETLIDQGELPNPSDFKGIGQEFVANPYAVEKEIFVECDRCDEVFMAEEDFEIHKSIDHGDDPDDYDEAEETFALSMDPDINREALREARKLLAETSEKDLYRNAFFNGKDIKEPTLSEPDDVKGTVGYNDNPNKGLYDTKLFTTGKSTSRYGGTVSESYAMEGAKDWWEGQDESAQEQILLASGVNVGHKGLSWLNLGEQNQDLIKQEYYDAREAYFKEGYKNSNPFDLTSDLEDVDDKDIPITPPPKSDEGGVGSGPQGTANLPEQTAMKQINPDYDAFSKDSGNQYDSPMIDSESHSDNEATPTKVTGDHGDRDADYNKTPTLAGDKVKNVPSAGTISALEGVDFRPEAIDYVYKTKENKTKANEAFVESRDVFLEGYGDDDIESDSEAVETLIQSRKMSGYGVYSIARELVMQYGISNEEAHEKVNSVEVSDNDRVANTIFGKRYSECTEAERTELGIYGGN